MSGVSLNKEVNFKELVRGSKGYFKLSNVKLHNLKGFDIEIPKGILVAVTGVVGSGKSSLIAGEFIRQYPETIIMNQKQIVRISRAILTTYMGIFDEIRELSQSPIKRAQVYLALTPKVLVLLVWVVVKSR